MHSFVSIIFPMEEVSFNRTMHLASVLDQSQIRWLNINQSFYCFCLQLSPAGNEILFDEVERLLGSLAMPPSNLNQLTITNISA